MSIFKKKSTPSFQNNQDTGVTRSTVVAREVISNGVIEGVTQIYLDNQPYYTSTPGVVNFPNVGIEIRKGEINQELTSNATGISTLRQFGVEVKNSQLPITRQFTNPELDSLLVTTRFTLNRRDDKGIFGDSCTYRIYLKEGDGAFVLAVERTISGLYSSPIDNQDEIPVNNIGGTVDRYQIRIEKVSPDSTNNDLVRTIELVSVSELIKDKITYEGTAYAEISFSSDLFSSEPPREFDVKGILCQIPTNSNVNPFDGGLDFSGTWNGLLKDSIIACRDPVWIMLETAFNPLYGTTNDIGLAKVQLSDLYTISKYNNEFISDGRGGLERRYLCDTVLEKVYKLSEHLDNFCSIFNSSYYKYAGKLRFWQDRPNNQIECLITNADIIGEFKVGYTNINSKSTIYNVSWNNPDLDFKTDVEPIRYERGIKKFGVKIDNTIAFGSTRLSQVIRYGRRAIYDNWLNTEIISFTMRPKGLFLLPGKLFEVSNNKKNKVRASGLIVSVNPAGNQITLDYPILIEPNTQNIFKCTLPDGTIQETNITNSPGNHDVINVIPGLGAIPIKNSTWFHKSRRATTKVYQVIDMIPDEEFNVEIFGILYNPQKWDFIENNISITDTPRSNDRTPETVKKPINLEIQRVYTLAGSQILVGWQLPDFDPFIKSYVFQISNDGISWNRTENINGNSYVFDAVIPGIYYVRVASVDILNRISEWTTGEYAYSITSYNQDMNFANLMAMDI